MKKILIFIMTIILFASCTGEESEEIDTTEDSNASSQNEHQSSSAQKLSPDVIKGIIQSIPNPYETSVLIKTSGAQYDASLLNDIDNTAKYNTDYKKATNLGIYSTDLGYANIYEKTQDAMNHLKAIQEMAKGLQVEKFFDYKTIKKLASSSENLDKLMEVSTVNVQNMNNFLQKEGRTDMTVLILTGAWVEALYLTSSIAANLQKPNEDINYKIADQKITLDQLLMLLEQYDSPKINKLRQSLVELQDIYKNVTITTVEVADQQDSPETVEDDEMISFSTNEETEIKITPENVKNIYAKLLSIRKTIVE